MDFKTKRRLTFIIVGGYLFLGGCEYAVIFPTAWDYLQSLGVTDEFWLGLTVSAYSFSAAIFGVLGGRLADVYETKTKQIALCAIVLMGIGNLEYTLGYSVWNIFAARLICGCGIAAGSAMLADVCRSTSLEERTSILAICNATRQMGILIGPAFQLILSSAYFKIGDWIEITPLNVPGLFMAVLWFFFAIATIIMFHNLPAEINAMSPEKRHALFHPNSPLTEAAPTDNANAQNLRPGTIEESHASAFSRTSISADDHLSSTRRPRKRRESVGERFINSLAQSGYNSKSQMADANNLIHASSFTISLPPRRYVNEFISGPFVLVFGMIFTIFFVQIGIETVIPVVMQNYFGYGDFENSLVYMAGGLEALLLFFVVAIISRYLRDTTMQVIGIVLMLASQIWLLVVMPSFEKGNTLHLIFFLIGVTVLYMGYPIASAANTSLFSKCLSGETQGLGQGLRRLSSYIGLIVGPAWAGSTVRNPYLFLGAPIAIIVVMALMLADSFNELRKIENKDRLENTNEEDSRSLLSN